MLRQFTKLEVAVNEMSETQSDFPRPQPNLAEIAAPEHTAVLVVDVQRAFTDLFRPPTDPPSEQVLPKITAFLRSARRAGVPVFLVRTVVSPEGHSRTTMQWPQHMRDNLAPGSPGTDYDACVERVGGDIDVVKPRYSSFIGTDLDGRLQRMGVETVIALGITTDVCVASSARDAWQHDFHTITLSDCCTAIAGGNHETALKTLAMNFGYVCTSDEVMSAWAPRVTENR